MWVVEADAPREQEAPLLLVHLVLVLQEVHTEEEGEQELRGGGGWRKRRGVEEVIR